MSLIETLQLPYILDRLPCLHRKHPYHDDSATYLLIVSVHRIRQTSKCKGTQQNNKACDANMNPDVHNYSSSGPTYELVDTNKGSSQIYAIPELSKEKASGKGNAGAATEDEGHYYHVLEGVVYEDVQYDCEGTERVGDAESQRPIKSQQT